MAAIRFRIRTLMIVIAMSAAMMGALRLAPPLFFALVIIVVQTVLFVLAIAGIPRLFAVYDWLIQRRAQAILERPSAHPGDPNQTEAGSPRECGLNCWLLAGWNRSAEFELALDDWDEFGLSRLSASRGLNSFGRVWVLFCEGMPKGSRLDRGSAV